MNTTRSIRTMVLAAGLLILATPARAESGDQSIGLFTAVHGAVKVARPGSPTTRPVSVQDDVYFRDVIETESRARTKAFFDDETILTVGENSRVTVDEHIYNPDADVRRVVVNLLMGKLRALVGKAFTGAGSKFEIHTPTAVAAARGTYFIVWVEQNGTSGLVNIGEAGKVDFTSGGRTVTVSPGEYSIAPANQPPVAPAVLNASTDRNSSTIVGATAGTALTGAGELVGTVGRTLGTTIDLAQQTVGNVTNVAQGVVGVTPDTVASVMEAITGTQVKDAPIVETAHETIQALGLATPVAPSLGSSSPTASVARSTMAESATDAKLTTVEQLAMQVLSTPTVVASPVSAAVSGPVAAVVSGTTSAGVIPPAVTSGASGGLGLPLP